MLGAECMTDSSSEDRRLLVSMSIGQTAYAAWARQARRERFFNIARLLEASAAVKQVRAEHALYRLGEVSKTIANIDRALAGLEPEAVATGTELEFVIMVIAVSCVKLLSAHNSTQHTSRKHKV
jgi:hypothetical protein